MDFQKSYLNINKFLLSITGFWPYQAGTEKFICRTMVLILWGGHFPSTTRRLIKFWENEDDVIEIITIYCTYLLGIIKITNSVHKNDKMKQLLEKIDADWNIWSNKPELEILKNFANEGRKFTLIYAIALYLSVIFYSLFTLSPQLLDIFLPIPNETRAKKYLQPEYYGPNMENYFVIIFIFAAIGILMNFTISASVDSMYVVYVQHACGIFSAIGQRLENIKYDCKSKDNKYSQEILFCVQQHKSILKYTEDLEETYTTYFFFLIIINVMVLIVNGIQYSRAEITQLQRGRLSCSLQYVLVSGHKFYQKICTHNDNEKLQTV
ncbi:uncharacterized protein LOC122504299 isoform X2 [Leptopilina heterotoma]|uniref:uncharacterized protein LOC122504299 isoform X2 n=1 Tax=Leptopilina heterotoma TaxID=63436 RepID=UPI001CA9CAF4|nr:uncharacterized protein LOC122504299 isoform X2 [Leptopilina heterotoma]